MPKSLRYLSTSAHIGLFASSGVLTVFGPFGSKVLTGGPCGVLTDTWESFFSAATAAATDVRVRARAPGGVVGELPQPPLLSLFPINLFPIDL